MCPYSHEESSGNTLITSNQTANTSSNQMPTNVSSHNQYNNQQQQQYNNNRQQQYIQQKRRNQRFNKQGQQQQQRNVGGMPVGNENPIINYNPSIQTQQQQPVQRQIVTNRPRNLVSIVTSIHEEDQDAINQQQHQRGIKRTCKK